MCISRMLHEHSRKLEVAVEGTYAGENGDPRVQLLSDSLRVCRTSDLELGRINHMAQRSLVILQEQLDRLSQSLAAQATPPANHPTALPHVPTTLERPPTALNITIINLDRK